MTPPIINAYISKHLLDRIGQQETFEVILDWYANSPQQYFILSAPTGVGKTAIIAEMSKYAWVMALAKTKALLSSVYNNYGFTELKGKRNHACAFAPHTHQADVCAIPDHFDAQEKYDICQGSGECSYYVQLDEFKSSYQAVTTYAKFMTDKKANNHPGLYSFDEAHELEEMVIEESGVNININNLRSYPYLKGFGKLKNNDDLGFDEGIALMRKIYLVASQNPPVKPKGDSIEEMVTYKRRMIRYRRFLDRIVSSGKLMADAEKEGLNIWHYSTEYNGNFSARPMTAAYHFKNVFGTGSTKTLLVSATISPYDAELLGLTEDEFVFYEAPQQYPPHMRPIYDLGQPGMGKKATDKNPSLWNIQALKISEQLKKRPDVSSVVVTTSKAKAAKIYNLLKRFGHDAFLPPENLGTDLQLAAWGNYRKSGAVCVSYNFWEGVSLKKDKMLFIAGIKYPDLSSAFQHAMAARSWKRFNHKAAMHLTQVSGRIQRGDLSDYLPIGNKQVFLVDGNYTRVLPFCPGDFSQRIVVL